MIINMPDGSNKGLLWSVDDKIYNVLTDLDITLPFAKGEVKDILYYNDILYVARYDTSNGVRLYEYDGIEWTSTKLYNAQYSSPRVKVEIQEFQGDIFVNVNNQYTSATTYFGKYDTETKTVSNIKTLEQSSGSVYSSLIKSEDGTKLYWVGLINYASNNFDLTLYTYDGTLKSAKIVTLSGTTVIGLLEYGNFLYVLCRYSDGFYCYVYSLDAKTYSGGANNDSQPISCTKNINGKTYTINSINELIEMKYGLSYESTLINTLAFTEYEDGIMVLKWDTGTFQKLKRYKIGTSYATKGTKIYTTNSFAISNNLEQINNGYLVTEDGEVKIGIYE